MASCQYDNKFTPSTSAIDTKTVTTNAPITSTCSSRLKKYLDKDSDPSYIPKGCLLDDPTSCFCPPNYKLNINPNNIIKDFCKSTGLNTQTYYYEGGCIGNNPTTTPEQALACCTGKATQVDPNTHCGTGYCPSGYQCLNTMNKYCNSANLTNDQFNNCINYLSLSTKPTKDWGNYYASSLVVNTMLNALYPNNNVELFGNPNNKRAIQICNTATPGACKDKLTKLCSKFTSRDQLNCKEGDTKCQEVASLCGCHLNPSLYFDYGKSDTIPIQCDPLCIVPGVVKLGRLNSSGTVWNEVNCSKNICVINYQNMADWNVSNVQVNQQCGTPKGGNDPYNCYIDVNVIGKNNSIINNNIGQECANCFSYNANDPTSVPQKIECKKAEKNYLTIYEIIGIGFLVAVIIILFILILLETKN